MMMYDDIWLVWPGRLADWKWQDMKMTDKKNAGMENAGLGKDGHKRRKGRNAEMHTVFKE